MTPVMITVQLGNPKVFNMLIEEGGSLLLMDNLCNNVLHRACEVGSYQIIDYILATHKRFAFFRNVRGYTPAQIAINSGHEERFLFCLNKHKQTF